MSPITLLILTWISFFHPFFVSITELKHNPKTKSLEVSCKVFSTDLETVLEKSYKQQIDLLKAADHARIDPLIRDYLQKHLVVKVDGKPVAFRYLGFEIEEDATWCYLEAVKVNQVRKMDIRNDLLYEEFPAQINMMHVTVKGKRQSIKLDNPDSQASFKF